MAVRSARLEAGSPSVAARRGRRTAAVTERPTPARTLAGRRSVAAPGASRTLRSSDLEEDHLQALRAGATSRGSSGHRAKVPARRRHAVAAATVDPPASIRAGAGLRARAVRG